LADYTQVKLTFLEIPIYSIKNWNEHCKHKDPSTFKDQDQQLQAQIITIHVDKEIRKLNFGTFFAPPNYIVVKRVCNLVSKAEAFTVR
jgi:hypothetical protein